ncbi:MAG: hypothetical protein NT027_10090 [Proteobacteria bacterium]|nr:hypothetical protein [Pseudomonadota bacterium]
MSFYDYKDYRDALRSLVKERKVLNHDFGFHSLADAARIQRPYMSKVIHGKAELSADQLFLICDALKLDSDQRSFLELLLEYSRSSLSVRKKKILAKIELISDSKKTTDSNLKSKVVEGSQSHDLSQYYLTPWTQLVHVALSIPRYAKDPNLLASILGISSLEMQNIISNLFSMNLLTTVDGSYQTLECYLHLNRQSPLFNAWRNQVRLAGIVRQQSLSETASYSFTALFSADEETRRRLQSKLLLLLKEFEGDVRDAPAKQMFQFSFDLFPWA